MSNVDSSNDSIKSLCASMRSNLDSMRFCRHSMLGGHKGKASTVQQPDGFKTARVWSDVIRIWSKAYLLLPERQNTTLPADNFVIASSSNI